MKQFIKKFITAWKQASAAEKQPEEPAAPPTPPEPPVPTARDLAATKYFLSEEFMKTARATAHDQLIGSGLDSATILYPKVAPKPQDLPALRTVTGKLKEEFPEIKRVYLSQYGQVVFDTLDAKARQFTDRGGPSN